MHIVCIRPFFYPLPAAAFYDTVVPLTLPEGAGGKTLAGGSAHPAGITVTLLGWDSSPEILPTGHGHALAMTNRESAG